MIPTEAVRVVEEHLRFYVDRPGTDWTVEAIAILEAVAPSLLPAVWDEGWRAHYLEWERQRADPTHPITSTNPYRRTQ